MQRIQSQREAQAHYIGTTRTQTLDLQIRLSLAWKIRLALRADQGPGGALFNDEGSAAARLAPFHHSL
jgi:hypothetical protein